MSIIKKLEKWRSNRNLQDHEFVAHLEVANILEEYTEYLRAKNVYEQIDALCDMCVFSYNAIAYLGGDADFIMEDIGKAYQVDTVLTAVADIKENGKHNITAFASIILLCRDRVEELGYAYEVCMDETIKEINSRLQDPKQMKDWAENGVSGKWQKDPNQEESTKYKANYELCKVTS